MDVNYVAIIANVKNEFAYYVWLISRILNTLSLYLYLNLIHKISKHFKILIMPLSGFLRRSNPNTSNTSSYQYFKNKPFLIPKSDWKLMKQMANLDDINSINGIDSTSSTNDISKLPPAPRIPPGNRRLPSRPKAAYGARTRHNIKFRVSTHLVSQSESQTASTYYCRICNKQVHSLSRRMKNSFRQMVPESVNVMCINCCQVSNTINDMNNSRNASNVINTKSRLKRLGFNLDVQVYVLIRNVSTRQTRVVSCYLPDIFTRVDIDSDTLTISPDNSKASIFYKKPFSELEKIITIAVSPSSSGNNNLNNWLDDWLANNVRSSPTEKIEQAECYITDTMTIGKPYNNIRRTYGKLPPIIDKM